MASTQAHGRSFIRHPADIPVDIDIDAAHRRADGRDAEQYEEGPVAHDPHRMSE